VTQASIWLESWWTDNTVRDVFRYKMRNSEHGTPSDSATAAVLDDNLSLGAYYNAITLIWAPTDALAILAHLHEG
jgi:hypothetical protein